MSMPAITPALASVVFGAGVAAGGVGALLGIGGGVFRVPLLHLALGFQLRTAAAISLATVIATSSSVSAARSGTQLINLRLGMVLEVATVAGSLLGGFTAYLFSESALQRLFAVVAVLAGTALLSRLNRRHVVLDPNADTGRLGGRLHAKESGGVGTYRVKRLPLALVASFAAGNVSSLLGIGGGIIKVPVLNAWCGVPVRAAAATSAFMIGVTAAGGAIIYFGRGQIVPVLAAAAVLGVQLGSWGGMRFAQLATALWLKRLMASVLIVVSGLMFVRAAH